jgi:hypothetical protein
MNKQDYLKILKERNKKDPKFSLLLENNKSDKTYDQMLLESKHKILGGLIALGGGLYIARKVLKSRNKGKCREECFKLKELNRETLKKCLDKCK